jgi:DNA sulfur modification protein DndE
MIDRLRLTAAARTQLSALKRKTGIAHNNAICRHALCVSLANPAPIPEEKLQFSDGFDIDWRTFTGGYEALYYNLVVVRLVQEKMPVSLEAVQTAVSLHVHRGLSYLSSRREQDLAVELARAVITKAKPS